MAIKENCIVCGIEFKIPRYRKQITTDGLCCSSKCCNEWWNNKLISEGKLLSDAIECKNCRCISIRRYDSDYCSKSCYTSFRNNNKLKDGSHNFGYENSKRSTSIQISKGLHPFQSGNMSEDSLKLKAEGISKARIRESINGNHIWQRPEIWINNEYSRSMTSIANRNLSEIILYMSECQIPNHFKIGWTSNLEMRSNDNRTHKLSNLIELRRGSPKLILDIEKSIKEKFFDRDFSIKNKTTEIFPISIKNEIVKYVNNFE